MTGNLMMMMKFRDLQVAEDVGKKAELGWFDVEFTMYGCAYLDRTDDRMRYKISSKEEDIYDFIELAARDDIFPSKIETLTLKCPVPMGTKDLIANDVKKELAKELRKKYQKEFFVELYQIADEIQSNHAQATLWQETEALTGIFDEERLKQFEDLVEYCYGCRKLKKEEYRLLMQWLQEEKANMNEIVSSKDIFEKTLYGASYIENDVIKYVNNAKRGSVYKEIYEAEEKGFFVTPLYNRTYWYNYKYRLSDAIKDYKNVLKEVRGIKYQEKLQILKADTLINHKQYKNKLQEIESTYGLDSASTMRRYLYRWGCSI